MELGKLRNLNNLEGVRARGSHAQNISYEKKYSQLKSI